MHRHQRQAEFADQHGCQQRHAHDVDAGCRHAHAKQHENGRRQDERGDHRAARQFEEQQRELAREAGQFDTADDHAGRCDCRDERYRGHAGFDAGLHEAARADGAASAHPAGKNDRHGRARRHISSRIALHEQQDQDGNGNDARPIVGERAAQADNFAFRHAAHVEPDGLKMHLREDAKVIEKGGGSGVEADVVVGDAREIRHDEGDSAHHRRQHRAARRGRSLNGAGALRAHPHPFHDRNAHRPRRCHIGHRRTGNGSVQARRHDTGFRRTADHAAGQRRSEIEEQLPAARQNVEIAEQDEEKGIAGGHIKRRSEDAVSPDRLHFEEIGVVDLAVAERPAHQMAEGGVEEQRQQYERQAKADRATAEFEREQNECRAGDKVAGRQFGEAGHPVRIDRLAPGKPAGGGDRGERQHPVDKPDARCRAHRACREKGHWHHQHEEDRNLQVLAGDAKQREPGHDNDSQHRKRGDNPADDALRFDPLRFPKHIHHAARRAQQGRTHSHLTQPYLVMPVSR